MVQLFLSEPTTEIYEENDAVKERICLLEKLESIILSLITSGGRNEARIWLCNTISSIHTISPGDQCGLFIYLLKANKLKKTVADQILRLIFEERPEKIGRVLARKSHIIEKFFEGNPRRILQWFDHFASSNESGHKKGARALAQYAFVNRDSCWEELEWKGRHGQSPAVVATKPHYFYDLDVLKTVENFLQYVPDFWSSDEFAESIKDGDILNLESKYFLDQFIHMMYKENSEVVWEVIEDFLMEVKFSTLSQRILILLDENSILTFVQSISKLIHPDLNCKEYRYTSCWLENLLSRCNVFTTLDDLLLLNTVISHGRHLLRFLRDEEHEEERRSIQELLKSAATFSNADNGVLMKKCLKIKKKIAVKYMGLQSWIVHYYLSRECTTPQSLESVFINNGLSYCKSNEYCLVRSDGLGKVGCSDTDSDSDSDVDDMMRNKGKKRKSKKRKKRRKNHDYEENIDDELIEFEKGLQCGGRSWILSTDNFSCTWNMTDLPEHLSRHCFVTWMKWISSK